MAEFLFFPASSITQLDRENFNLIDIYGGNFYLKLPHIIVYLAQPFQKNDRTNKLIGLSDLEYNFILKNLIENKVIYVSKLKKEEPFNKRKVLGSIMHDNRKFPRTLNIGEVTLELTQSCPYHCEGCFREMGGNSLTPISRLEEILQELSNTGLSKLSLSGGEITSSKKSFERFQAIASYAHTLDIEKIRLLTTGYDPQRVKKALNYINEIQISIDGLEKTHDYYKGFKGAFERAIESLKICENSGIKITTNTVVSQLNINEVPDLIDFLTQFEIDTIRITKIMSSKSNLRLNPAKARKLYELVRQKQEEHSSYRIVNAYGDCTDVLNCTGGIVYAHIGASGNVFPCDYDIGNIAGNINEKSFQDIWTNSPVIKKYRNITPVDENCLECPSRVFCFGNCRIDKEYVLKTKMCENEN